MEMTDGEAQDAKNQANEGHSSELSAEDRWLSDACRALGHPIRLRILKHLAGGGCACGRIVEILPLAQSTVSQHLKVLRTAGLIRGIIEGPLTCYCLDQEQIARLKELVTRL